ncbi:MAG: hypothetical protein IPO22_14195 [Anaerolineales bacterium]|nr:hypothetical protein [Anaerolineales bacterium]
MVTVRRTYLALAMVFATSFACALPSIPASNTDAINSTVTQNAPQEIPSATLEIPPTLTFTPTVTSAPLVLAYTLTPTLTFTPYSIFGASTPTFIAPMISVSAPTHCRNGPGKAYGVEGTLMTGETAEVYGRDPTSEYFYIRNPDPGVEFCWVWGAYATPSESMLPLPVLIPPPTPTPTITPTPVPSFDMEYISSVKCTGWRIKIQVTNTSSQPFKSMTIEIKDQVTEVELTASTDEFKELNGCPTIATKDRIDPGDTFLISSPQFDTNPKGHQFRAFITLCTEKGQSAGCITRKLNFTSR